MTGVQTCLFRSGENKDYVLNNVLSYPNKLNLTGLDTYAAIFKENFDKKYGDQSPKQITQKRLSPFANTDPKINTPQESNNFTTSVKLADYTAGKSSDNKYDLFFLFWNDTSHQFIENPAVQPLSYENAITLNIKPL